MAPTISVQLAIQNGGPPRTSATCSAVGGMWSTATSFGMGRRPRCGWSDWRVPDGGQAHRLRARPKLPPGPAVCGCLVDAVRRRTRLTRLLLKSHGVDVEP